MIGFGTGLTDTEQKPRVGVTLGGVRHDVRVHDVIAAEGPAPQSGRWSVETSRQ